VLEGIGFALRALAGEMCCGGSKEMLILGGGSRLDFWVQLIANIFERTLVRSNGDGLDGAAQIAGVPAQDFSESSRLDAFFFCDDSKRDMLARRYRLWLCHCSPSFAAVKTPASSCMPPRGR
jgi:sugar (pentulose or hexulose) kinase